MASERHKSHIKQFISTRKLTEKTDSPTRSAGSSRSLPCERQKTFVVSSPQTRASTSTDNTRESSLNQVNYRSHKSTGNKVDPKHKSVRSVKGATVASRIRREKPTADGLPEEILRLIFSRLDANDLLICGCVCKRWLEITNDNSIWKGVYRRLVSKSKKGHTNSNHPVNPPSSYWKYLCIRRCSEVRDRAALAQLKKIHPFSGLPANTEKALCKSGVQWCLEFVDTDNREQVIVHRDAFYFAMAACVRWYSLDMPPVATVRKIRLFAAKPVFYDGVGRPHPNSPNQRSLLMEMDFQWSTTSPPFPVVAASDSIRIYVLPSNLLLATWKDGGEVAFISANFHHHNLVQRCILGKSDRAYSAAPHVPIQDDLDSKRGLHGYNVTIELRNQRVSFFSQQFRDLYCQPEDIGNGYAEFHLIQESRNYEHAPLGRKIAFPWKTDAFKGIVENIFILDVTVLDESGTPMWCVSVPVKLSTPGVASVVYDYDGDHYLIDYMDISGKIKGKMVWEEEIGQYMMMSLDMCLTLKFIDEWFGTSLSNRTSSTQATSHDDSSW